MPYKVVPTDPRTGRVIRDPKTYDWVRYAIQTPRGKIRVLKQTPVQRFTKKDFAGMNRSISGKKDFIVYEELTLRYQRDKNGDPIPTGKIDKRTGKPAYKRETKITFLRPDRKQRPVLYREGHRRRSLDIGFQNLSPRQQADQKIMTMVTPSKTPPIRYEVEGDSIRNAMSNLVLALDRDKIYDDEGKKVAGLYYNIIIHLKKPDGRTIRIPASGALPVLEKFKDIFPQLATRMYRETGEVAFRKEVITLANMQREIGWTVAHSLSKVGYRFTRTVDLKKYAGQMNRELGRLSRDAAEARAAGQKAIAERKERSIGRVTQARDNMINRIGKKKLIDRRNYKLWLNIEFERIPVK